MTTLKCLRFGSKFPRTAENGDRYDSTLGIYDEHGLVREFEWVNTDYSGRFKYIGGILKEGVYDFVAGIFKGKYLALKLCRNWSGQKWTELSRSQCTFDSITKNRNHGGSKIITDVWIHRGGLMTDGSMGCITLHPEIWDKFAGYFALNEHGKFELARDPRGLIPDFYGVKDD